VPGVVPKYNWTYPALVTIMREEGVVALYKGFVPKVLRLAPGGGVLLLVVEFTLGVFRQGMSFLDVMSHSTWLIYFHQLLALPTSRQLGTMIAPSDDYTLISCMGLDRDRTFISRGDVFY
jgi:hypothetical protein